MFPDMQGFVPVELPVADGYTRISNNLCVVDVPVGFTMTRDSCTKLDSPSPHAVAVILQVATMAGAANAIAARQTVLYSYQDSICSSILDIISKADGYEHTAVSAGTILCADYNTVIIQLDKTGGSAYLRYIDDVGNQGSAEYHIVGYYEKLHHFQ